MKKDSFLKVSEELEKLNNTFRIEGSPPEYKGVWLPNNEVRLWSIPRSSAELLKLFVLSRKPKTILELGTSAGYSAIWMASALKEWRGGKIYTIELAKPKIDMAREYFRKAKVEDYIIQLQGEISKVLKEWNKKIDFVFMDADKSNYLNYIKQIESHLNDGAVIIADNAIDFKHLMKDYLDYVTKSEKYHSYLIPLDNGLMVSIKIN